MKRIIILIMIIITTHAQGYEQVDLLNDISKYVQWDKSVYPRWLYMKPNSINFKTIYRILNKQPTIKFKINEIRQDELGFTHTILQEYYNDIKVETATLIVHEKSGYVYALNGNILIPNSVNDSIAVDSIQAKQVVKNYVYHHYNCDTGLFSISVKESLFIEINGMFYLTYKISVLSDTCRINSTFFVGTSSGNILEIEDNTATCVCCNGNANTLFYGPRAITTKKVCTLGIFCRYRLHDECRGHGIHTVYYIKNIEFDVHDPNNNFTNSLKDRQAASAHWAA